ncbi:MAG: hypothetical protein MHPSP_001625 [Paramarteilia canceri]
MNAGSDCEETVSSKNLSVKLLETNKRLLNALAKLPSGYSEVEIARKDPIYVQNSEKALEKLRAM